MIPAPTYGKTENLLLRDEETHKLIPGSYRNRAFEQVSRWLVTEKIDGTNIRLIYRQAFTGSNAFEVRGRTDNATLPKGFVEEAIPHVVSDLMADALEAIDPKGVAYGMVVFGEGYGAGIQKGGGAYAQQKSLRIFDVYTLKEGEPGLWRPFSDVRTVANILDVPTVPVISEWMSTSEVYAFVAAAPWSIVSSVERHEYTELRKAEGVVARTDPYLYDSYGSRVLFKLKTQDLL